MQNHLGLTEQPQIIYVPGISSSTGRCLDEMFNLILLSAEDLVQQAVLLK